MFNKLLMAAGGGGLTFIDASIAGAGSGTSNTKSFTINKPPNAAPGDVMFIVISARSIQSGHSPTLAAVAGWTSVVNQGANFYRVMRRVVQPGDAGWTVESTQCHTLVAGIVAYRNAGIQGQLVTTSGLTLNGLSSSEDGSALAVLFVPFRLTPGALTVTDSPGDVEFIASQIFGTSVPMRVWLGQKARIHSGGTSAMAFTVATADGGIGTQLEILEA